MAQKARLSWTTSLRGSQVSFASPEGRPRSSQEIDQLIASAWSTSDFGRLSNALLLVSAFWFFAVIGRGQDENADAGLLIESFGVFVLIGGALSLRALNTRFFASYSFDSPASVRLQDLATAAREMAKAQRVRALVGASDVVDFKRSAGANSALDFEPAVATVSQPHWIRSDSMVLVLKARGHELCFLPDRLLFRNMKSEVRSAPYSGLSVTVGSQKYVDHSPAVPRDAKVIGKTWQFVNKSGGPDRRYKNNVELPILAVDGLFLKIDGFDWSEIFVFSRTGTAHVFAKVLQSYQRFWAEKEIDARDSDGNSERPSSELLKARPVRRVSVAKLPPALLRRARVEAGLTVSAVSARLDVDVELVRAWEDGSEEVSDMHWSRLQVILAGD